MKSHTHYLTFNTKRRRELRRITDDVQAIVPITKGKLDLGPWQQVFYYEFDGRRPKRLVLKAIGD